MLEYDIIVGVVITYLLKKTILYIFICLLFVCLFLKWGEAPKARRLHLWCKSTPSLVSPQQSAHILRLNVVRIHTKQIRNDIIVAEPRRIILLYIVSTNAS
jgi:hypothetical protein